MTTESGILHEGEREAQKRFGVATEGQAMSRIVRDHLSSGMIRFVEAQPFFFIATADDRGECDCSFRGRQHNPPVDPDPAVKVLDARTLIFPDYSGNNLFNSLGNIMTNPHIGMLFIDFRNPTRLRINGRAEIIEDKRAFGDIWPEAQRYIKVTVLQAYPNCRQRVPAMVMKP